MEKQDAWPERTMKKSAVVDATFLRCLEAKKRGDSVPLHELGLALQDLTPEQRMIALRFITAELQIPTEPVWDYFRVDGFPRAKLLGFVGFDPCAIATERTLDSLGAYANPRETYEADLERSRKNDPSGVGYISDTHRRFVAPPHNALYVSPSEILLDGEKKSMLEDCSGHFKKPLEATTDCIRESRKGVGGLLSSMIRRRPYAEIYDEATRIFRKVVDLCVGMQTVMYAEALGIDYHQESHMQHPPLSVEAALEPLSQRVSTLKAKLQK